MQTTNSVLGNLTYEDHQEITILGGIPGFEGQEKYVLMTAEGQEPFGWLQSLDNPQLAFVVVNPFLIREDYHPEFAEQDLARLGIANVQEEAMLLVIVTLTEKWEESTVNLMAPLLINIKSRQARQVIIEKGELPLRCPIFA